MQCTVWIGNTDTATTASKDCIIQVLYKITTANISFQHYSIILPNTEVVDTVRN